MQVGPQDSFLALLDLNAAHSNCRLCIHIATNIRKAEAAARNSSAPAAASNATEARPPLCKCRKPSGSAATGVSAGGSSVGLGGTPGGSNDGGGIVHHVRARERGRFYFRDVFLEEPSRHGDNIAAASDVTVAGLHKAILQEF